MANPSTGRFCWHELVTTDLAAATKFYGELVGWTFRDNPSLAGGTYRMFALGETMVSGAIAAPAGVPSGWLVYVAVDDTDASAKKIAELGGKIIDLVNRQLYWSDYAAPYPKNILRVGLDGSNVTGLLKLPFAPLTLTVSSVERKMYWSDNTGIFEAGYDGHNQKQTLAIPSSYTKDIAVDSRGKKLYFIDQNASEARRANLDGTGGYETLLTDVTYPMGIELYICSP